VVVRAVRPSGNPFQSNDPACSVRPVTDHQTLITMKALVLPCMLASASLMAQTTHTISTVGTSFSPALVNAVEGDEIDLTIAAPHTFTQVDEATWNANGNTPNGGYNFSAGSHSFTVTEPGTIWYVCSPHASMGMKGRIVVSINTGVDELGSDGIALAPNPATDVVRFTGLAGTVQADLFDTKGARVLSRTVANGTLDVSSMLPGSYVCVVRGADGTPLLRAPLEIRR